MSGGGILSGREIDRMVKEGKIEIDPYRPEHLNPASIDLTLGSGVIEVHAWPDNPLASDGVLDVKNQFSIENGVLPIKVIGAEGFLLKPGRLYLMHTIERISTLSFVPVLDGKSSLGRLGVSVHETAGYGDPGFDGQYTLEVISVHWTRVYAGMRFCQMRFHTLVGEVEDYKLQGSYTGEASRGPVPSAVWKQFIK